jgi:hypothetical protein
MSTRRFQLPLPTKPKGGWHVQAYRWNDHGTRLYAMWCPWCRRPHTHGDNAGQAVTNRAAHCHTDSPFRDTGYTLHVVGCISSIKRLPKLTAAEVVAISSKL